MNNDVPDTSPSKSKILRRACRLVRKVNDLNVFASDEIHSPPQGLLRVQAGIKKDRLRSTSCKRPWGFTDNWISDQSPKPFSEKAICNTSI